MEPTPLHLAAGRDRGADIDAFAAAQGGRVGLAGVLADLDRVARPAFDTGSAATGGFRWDAEDEESARWWPQGITSSADAGLDGTEEYAGRRLLLTTAYSKTVNKVNKGCRITVCDLTDEGQIRYGHVLLAVVGRDDGGMPELRPLHAHAGGAVWRGPILHVAATGTGVHTFHIDDVVGVPAEVGLGHRYVLPLRATSHARTRDGVEPMRYSFLSLARTSGASALLAGEYGGRRSSRRLITYPLGDDGQLGFDTDGRVEPSFLPQGPAKMQGAVLLDGRLHVVTSNGRRGRGSLWVGAPGELRRAARVLPPGPEDVTWWPSRDELWVPNEYPGRRFVLAYPRSRFAL